MKKNFEELGNEGVMVNFNVMKENMEKLVKRIRKIENMGGMVVKVKKKKEII